MNIFKKFVFIINKPSVILIVGQGRLKALRAVRFLLESCLQRKGIIVFESDLSKPKDIKFYLRKSKLPILLVTNTGEIPFNKFSFEGDKKEAVAIREMAKSLPAGGFLVLNFDDEAVREIKNKTKAAVLTYGFQEKADIKISDVNIDSEEMNFKVNIEGNIIPFWIKKRNSEFKEKFLDKVDKEYIYSAAAAIAVGKIQNINLVNLSQKFRGCNLDYFKI